MMSLEPQILSREETDLYLDHKSVWMDVTKGDCGKTQQDGQARLWKGGGQRRPRWGRDLDECCRVSRALLDTYIESPAYKQTFRLHE